MIKKNDSERLVHHFPEADWESLFWGFTCYSRQAYARLTQLDAVDEILLGLQNPGGGCLCELGIRWHLLHNELVPQLNVFSEAWPLLQTPTLQLVLEQLTREGTSQVTPDEVSALLITCGFADQSDRALDNAAPNRV